MNYLAKMFVQFITNWIEKTGKRCLLGVRKQRIFYKKGFRKDLAKTPDHVDDPERKDEGVGHEKLQENSVVAVAAGLMV